MPKADQSTSPVLMSIRRGVKLDETKMTFPYKKPLGGGEIVGRLCRKSLQFQKLSYSLVD